MGSRHSYGSRTPIAVVNSFEVADVHGITKIPKRADSESSTADQRRK